MYKAKRSGVYLAYDKAGSGADTLVFVHGWCCNHTFFEPQIELFRDRYSVVSVDLRGCGESDCPADGYDIPSLANDVATIVADACDGPAVVVGHSLGSMIAIELSNRHPSAARAVIALDPGPIDPLSDTHASFRELTSRLSGPDNAEIRRNFIGGMFGTTCETGLEQEITEQMCSVPGHVAHRSMQGISEWNGAESLRLCNTPLLVILSQPGGSNDPSRLRAIKPDTAFGITVGSGHFIQLEVPDQVNAMIDQYLRVLQNQTTA